MEAQHRTVIDDLNVEGLITALRSTVSGDVKFDAGSRALYATDGSNYRQPPIGLVIPKSADDVVATIAACRRYRVPLLNRGCGTSLAGQCCNAAVVMDLSIHLNHILEINPEEKWARVEPGVILDNLREAAEEYQLTFAPDPATHTHNTLGGMIGDNSCGVHSMMGGRTADNVIELDIVTYDGLRMTVGATSDEELEAIIAEGKRRGRIYQELKQLVDQHAEEIRRRYPDIPRRVSGHSLDELLPEKGFNIARALVGTESTCVTVLEAKVRLVDSPPYRTLLVLGYPDVYAAGDHVPEIRQFGPLGIEGLDAGLIRDMWRSNLHLGSIPYLPQGRGWLLCEFGGWTKEEAIGTAERAKKTLESSSHSPEMYLYTDREEQNRVWEIRESGLGATAHVPGKKDTWPGWEDSAVPPEHVGDYLRALRYLFDKYGYECDLYGHFGQGCIHTRIDFDLRSRQGIEQYRKFAEEAADLVVSMGGSFSGEHGDGQARGELLPRMFGEELVEAMRRFKRIWDPTWKMNPGKVIDPYRMDENLRLGTDYNPPHLKTEFQLPEDRGDFANFALRCVGVGKCRREKGGTMCPSFMVTREEKHSTRGRARLLFEMVRGDVITNGWREETVKDALELCLACKGCKGECPVNVDMATYKGEFNYHYYKLRPRPLKHYAFGHLDIWSHWASKSPAIVNVLMHSAPLSGLAKWMIGIAPQRQLPRFAHQTFQAWFAKHETPNPIGLPVLLWPDTFNNYWFPEILKSAVQVLEAGGYRVMVPEKKVCCGRPLYDIGMLPRAKRLLKRNLRLLHNEITDGVPFIALEPACGATFIDELVNLFPDEPQAQRLARQTYSFAAFVQENSERFELPSLDSEALLHLHCNHKALQSTEPDVALLKAMGIRASMPTTGCCGMAGSFGFERDKYDLSVACGERVLLPEVRNSRDRLVITDGYSCREQIRQATGRRALHIAEVAQMALQKGISGTASSKSPEPFE
ncbi:FAD-binding and (Fe-S)-binding domain-containing protein [Thiohalomonas denitrificans]|uniref:FAD/FMN-containing dehydrogenase n=1 Tax=Thiohalomonas denitrificans TaxID=415747 RepID=A0A1G5QNC3_9GAMM|nr:FAD-binding and (Fe-S)-binding domain-containing protein [Thiohalomonas denitrificans]SCZ63344.1 FAD/FMN-containing dehydrogenase [Thiohalomonas denitrificans]